MQHCFKFHWEFLTLQGLLLHVEHILFFEGCTSQFKCAKVMFFVVCYPSLTKKDDLLCLWDVPCSGTILVLVMVKDIGMVQELLLNKHYELNKLSQI